MIRKDFDTEKAWQVAKFTFALLAVLLAVTILPSPYWLLFFIILCVVARILIHWERVRAIPTIAILVTVFLIRWGGAMAVAAECNSLPMRSSSTADFMWNYFPFSIFGYTDLYEWHRNVWQRTEIARGTRTPRQVRAFGHAFWGPFTSGVDYSVIDPFSGEPYRRMNSIEYSVGPDGIDHRLEVIYDPSNGTFSRGDIVRFPNGR